MNSLKSIVMMAIITKPPTSSASVNCQPTHSTTQWFGPLA